MHGHMKIKISFSLFILAIFLREIIKLIFLAKSQDIYINLHVKKVHMSLFHLYESQHISMQDNVLAIGQIAEI
jgi:hypothetical protein